MSRRSSLPAIATVALASAMAASTPRARATPAASVLPEPPKIVRLDNGFTTVLIPWDSPGIVAYYTLMRVGSRDEVEPGHSGFAHLFEHMMFRGTRNYPGEAYRRVLQSFGADDNAYTTQDFTLYVMTAPAAELPTLIELEADRFQRLSYTRAEYETETGAVRGEYDKSAASPDQRMWETLSELAFRRHTYGHTTIGYLRDIERMPRRYAYSRAFFRRYYTPDNCTLFVVGDFDAGEAAALIERHYGTWRGKRHKPRIPREPEPEAGARRHLSWTGTAPPQLMLGYRVPAFAGDGTGDPSQALRTTGALQVVHELAFSASSPLYQRLVVDERAALELGSDAGDFQRDPGLFVVEATVPPGGDPARIEGAIQAELARIAAGDVDPARVDAVKSHLRYALILSLDTPGAVANTLARFVALTGDLDVVDDYQAALAAVTPEDVARVAADYLSPSRRFTVTLAPGAPAADEARP